MPTSPEMHIFQAEIRGGKQVVTCWKPQHGTVIANSSHHSAIFWQSRVAVTMPLRGAGSGGNLDLRDELFF